MTQVSSVLDSKGQPVAPGDLVRILSVSPDPDMDEEDLDLFMDMVGSTCEVERVDEDGFAWVTVWWATSEGSITTTTALDASQMLKVESY